MTPTRLPAVEALGSGGPPPERIWYTSYGSNMHRGRLACYLAGGTPAYLAGGTPAGVARGYPGCRDPRAPARSVPVELPGRLYFATESAVWTGGRAFYDPSAQGRLRARAHLVTVQQFSDIAAQEMYREPGADIDLTRVLRTGRDELGPGRYETLVCSGALDGTPVLTFTAHWAMHEVEWVSPAASYVAHLAAGLLESGAWKARSVAKYLARCPGAAGAWNTDRIAALLASP